MTTTDEADGAVRDALEVLGVDDLLLGFDAIRDLTAGLLLVEQLLPRGKGVAPVREGFARSLRCGLVAQALSARVGYPNPEEAYLLGLFANLGTLWLAAHYPDRFAEARAATAGERGLETSIAHTFGVRPADLAARILEHWGFPPHYTGYFRDARPGDRSVANDQEAKLAATVSLASDYSSGDVALEDILARFERLFGLPREQFIAAARTAEQALHEQAPALGITLPRTVPAMLGGILRRARSPYRTRLQAGLRGDHGLADRTRPHRRLGRGDGLPDGPWDGGCLWQLKPLNKKLVFDTGS